MKINALLIVLFALVCSSTAAAQKTKRGSGVKGLRKQRKLSVDCTSKKDKEDKEAKVASAKKTKSPKRTKSPKKTKSPKGVKRGRERKLTECDGDTVSPDTVFSLDTDNVFNETTFGNEDNSTRADENSTALNKTVNGAGIQQLNDRDIASSRRNIPGYQSSILVGGILAFFFF